MDFCFSSNSPIHFYNNFHQNTHKSFTTKKREQKHLIWQCIPIGHNKDIDSTFYKDLCMVLQFLLILSISFKDHYTQASSKEWNKSGDFLHQTLNYKEREICKCNILVLKFISQYMITLYLVLSCVCFVWLSKCRNNSFCFNMCSTNLPTLI